MTLEPGLIYLLDPMLHPPCAPTTLHAEVGLGANPTSSACNAGGNSAQSSFFEHSVVLQLSWVSAVCPKTPRLVPLFPIKGPFM